jgi:hypothetical protein
LEQVSWHCPLSKPRPPSPLPLEEECAEEAPPPVPAAEERRYESVQAPKIAAMLEMAKTVPRAKIRGSRGVPMIVLRSKANFKKRRHTLPYPARTVAVRDERRPGGKTPPREIIGSCGAS